MAVCVLIRSEKARRLCVSRNPVKELPWEFPDYRRVSILLTWLARTGSQAVLHCSRTPSLPQPDRRAQTSIMKDMTDALLWVSAIIVLGAAAFAAAACSTVNASTKRMNKRQQNAHPGFGPPSAGIRARKPTHRAHSPVLAPVLSSACPQTNAAIFGNYTVAYAASKKKFGELFLTPAVQVSTPAPSFALIPAVAGSRAAIGLLRQRRVAQYALLYIRSAPRRL